MKQSAPYLIIPEAPADLILALWRGNYVRRELRIHETSLLQRLLEQVNSSPLSDSNIRPSREAAFVTKQLPHVPIRKWGHFCLHFSWW